MSAGSLGFRVGVGKVSCSGPIVVLGSFEGAGAAARARVGCVCRLLLRLVWVGGVEFGTSGFSRVAGFCGGARIFGLGGTGSVGAHGNGEVLGVGPLFGGLTSFLPRIVVLAYCGYVYSFLPHWLPACSHHPAAHAAVQTARGAGLVY